jgi:hypothetical protein
MIKKIGVFIIALLATTYLSACFFQFDGEQELTKDPVLPANKEITLGGSTPVYEIDFSDVLQTKTVYLTGLQNKSVYLVKYSPQSVTAINTGHAEIANNERSVKTSPEIPAISLHAVSGIFTAADGTTVTRYDHRAAQEFNHNPPPVTQAGGNAASRNVGGNGSSASNNIGDTKQFWVEENTESTWTEISATLKAQGAHSSVWVADVNFDESSSANNDNKITRAQAQMLASKFDEIYRRETPVFGYEYGGGVPVDDSTYGGVDGDPRIQILVSDIYYDFTSTQAGGTFGYFWSKDYYQQDKLAGNVKTNLAEIFYLDAHFTDRYQDGMVSTLAHEFQHMINFNEKYINRRKVSSTWFDEMLAMLAEDMLDPLIDVAEEEYPYKKRIPLFLNRYSSSGPTEWHDNDLTTALASYANVYAFGAYLARNFGGADLVQAIMQNAFVDKDSITAAVNSLNVQGSDWTFPKIESRYGETLVFSGDNQPQGVFSFDKTVSNTIGETNYEFASFDIWQMSNPSNGAAYYKDFYYPEQGPWVMDTSLISNMNANTFLIQSCEAWQGVSGDLTITFYKPASSAVKFFVMIK